MFHRFQHQTEVHPELNQLPLYARMKLDMAGIKVSLKQWLAFALEERRVICHLPVESEEELKVFSEYVNFLCRNRTGSAAQRLPPVNPALWNTPGRIPQAVIETSRARGRAITREEWARWAFHERYALYKAANSNHEPEKFSALLLQLRQRKTES